MGCESLKVGIIVGLEREKRLVPKKSNIFVEKGYGQKAYFVAKKLISKKIDVLISFGLAKSISKKIENTQILIPKTKNFDAKKTKFRCQKNTIST